MRQHQAAAAMQAPANQRSGPQTSAHFVASAATSRLRLLCSEYSSSPRPSRAARSGAEVDANSGDASQTGWRPGAGGLVSTWRRIGAREPRRPRRRPAAGEQPGVGQRHRPSYSSPAATSRLARWCMQALPCRIGRHSGTVHGSGSIPSASAPPAPPFLDLALGQGAPRWEVARKRDGLISI